MQPKIQQIYDDLSKELIWLLQHPPLYTAGIGATDDDIIEKLFPIYKTGRGGKYTYHGPGAGHYILNARPQKKKQM